LDDDVTAYAIVSILVIGLLVWGSIAVWWLRR
jgi:hypothetical protein